MGLFDGITGQDALRKMERTAQELEEVYGVMATHIIELREQQAELVRQNRAIVAELERLRPGRESRRLRWLGLGAVASALVAIVSALHAAWR